jgi:small GTP-binding protein
VERERGITVKAQTCSMIYNHNGEDYLLHLVDTPGHVDFRAEVSRSYASCGGALLLVDASQGVQAQTVSNFYLAFAQGLTLVPVLNKIDLPSSDPQRTIEQLRVRLPCLHIHAHDRRQLACYSIACLVPYFSVVNSSSCSIQYRLGIAISLPPFGVSSQLRHWLIIPNVI